MIRHNTDADIKKQLAEIIPYASVQITRADRHDQTSHVNVVVIQSEIAVEFMMLTQIAGLFETPNIEISAESEHPWDYPTALVVMRVSW